MAIVKDKKLQILETWWETRKELTTYLTCKASFHYMSHMANFYHKWLTCGQLIN